MNKLVEAVAKATGFIMEDNDVQDIVAQLDGRHGWKLVPVEPIREQMDAAEHDWRHNHGPESRRLHGENVHGIYRVMLAAAPDPLAAISKVATA